MAHGRAYSSYAARVAGLALAAALAGVPLVADAATASVSIQGFAFRPAATTMNAGDAVTWKDLDGVQHTATADGGAWTTGVLNSGQTSAAITFSAPGVFTYHCAIHAFMTGSITVLAAATPRPTAPPPPPTPVPTPVRAAQPTPPPAAAPAAAPTVEPEATAVPTVLPSVAPATATPLALASASATAEPEPSPVAGGAIAALALAVGALWAARRRA